MKRRLISIRRLKERGSSCADRVSCSTGSYFSVPQIGQYFSSSVNEMKDAIASIPAYIERCSHCALLASPQPTPPHSGCHLPGSQFSLLSRRCGTTTFPTSRATMARGLNVAGAGSPPSARPHPPQARPAADPHRARPRLRREQRRGCAGAHGLGLERVHAEQIVVAGLETCFGETVGERARGASNCSSTFRRC